MQSYGAITRSTATDTLRCPELFTKLALPCTAPEKNHDTSFAAQLPSRTTIQHTLQCNTRQCNAIHFNTKLAHERFRLTTASLRMCMPHPPLPCMLCTGSPTHSSYPNNNPFNIRLDASASVNLATGQGCKHNCGGRAVAIDTERAKVP